MVEEPSNPEDLDDRCQMYAVSCQSTWRHTQEPAATLQAKPAALRPRVLHQMNGQSVPVGTVHFLRRGTGYVRQNV
jgi:hypothetical protein